MIDNKKLVEHCLKLEYRVMLLEEMVDFLYKAVAFHIEPTVGDTTAIKDKIKRKFIGKYSSEFSEVLKDIFS